MRTSSKKSFQTGSSLSSSDPKHKYELLYKLPIRFITPISRTQHERNGAASTRQSEREFDPLLDRYSSEFRFNNTAQLQGGMVRRDEKYHESILLHQKSIIDLGDLVLASKIHLKGLPGSSIVNIYASLSPYEDYQLITKSQVVKHQ